MSIQHRRPPEVADPIASWPLDQVYSSSLGDIRWARLGGAHDRPVVLLHGTPFSSFIWRDVGRALAQQRRVYVWDMPGYGQSAKSADQDLSLAALVSVFVELLRHWDINSPDVIAHDSGGAVALGALIDNGVAYRSLALVDAVSLDPWGSQFFEVVSDNVDVFGGLPPALHEALLREYVQTASHRGLRASVLDALVDQWCGEEGQAAFYRQLRHRSADESYIRHLKTSYGDLRQPVRLVWGTQDTWVPAERGRELAATIPGARLTLIEGAGHLVQEDAPGELTSALISAIDG